MRIAVNTRFLIKNKLEGIGWFTHEVVRRLVNDHPEHEFLFIFDRPYPADFLFSPNVEAIQLAPPARHPLLWYLWFEWSIPFVLKKYKSDVFFSPDGYLSLRSKIPAVMVMHDLAYVHFPEQIPTLARKYYQYFMPLYLKKAKQLITVSNFVKKDISRNYQDIAPEKISVACNGVRAAFRPLPEKEQEKVKARFSQGKDYFFYLGAVHPRKNVHRLIHSFDLFKKKTSHPIKLLIGGRFAWQTGEVKSAYDEAEHKDDIQFLGYLSEEELPLLMGAATALTYPSSFEGFGVPILEAMHCDVPVITSNRSSMPEVAGNAGLLIDPENLHQLAAALEQIIFDQNKRALLIANGRVQRQQYSWEKAAAVCYQAIEKAASGIKSL